MGVRQYDMDLGATIQHEIDTNPSIAIDGSSIRSESFCTSRARGKIDAAWFRKPMLYPLSYEGGEDLRIPGSAYRCVAGRP